MGPGQERQSRKCLAISTQPDAGQIQCSRQNGYRIDENTQTGWETPAMPGPLRKSENSG